MSNSHKEIEIQNRIEKYGEKLYHYTSFAALYGIIKNQELWLGNTATMNDKFELINLIESIKKALLEDIDNEYKVKCEGFFDIVFSKIEEKPLFASCFSRLKDDAAQWERYADNAKGVCLEFDSRTLLSLFFYKSSRLNEVFYSCDPREHDFYQILTYYFDNGKLPYDFTEESLAENMINTSGVHKHKGFASENEIRLITSTHGDAEYSSFDFITLNGTIRKILKMNLGELCKEEGIAFEKLFSKIIIGPRSNQNIIELKEFVCSCGLYELAENIEVSNCPLR